MDQKKVKLIEDSPFNLSSKINLLLTYGGRKPVSSVVLKPEIFKWPVKQSLLDNIHYSIKSQRVEDAYRTLDSLGLPYQEEKHDDVHYDDTSRNLHATHDEIDFLVADSKENLQKFIAADHRNDTYEMGVLFGFPKTAAKAFANGTIGDDMPTGPTRAFFQWEPSRDHYVSERMHAFSNEIFVKRNSPKLYGEVKLYFPE